MKQHSTTDEQNRSPAHRDSTWAFLAPLVAGAVILFLNALGPGNAAALLIGVALTVVGVVGFLRSTGTARTTKEAAHNVEP